MKVSSVVPVFSNWVNVVIKAPSRNISRNSKSLKGIYFFSVENRKLRFFQSQCRFFCYIACITLFQSSLGYVCIIKDVATGY